MRLKLKVKLDQEMELNRNAFITLVEPLPPALLKAWYPNVVSH